VAVVDDIKIHWKQNMLFTNKFCVEFSSRIYNMVVLRRRGRDVTLQLQYFSNNN
jgi:hypothetical protein